MKKTAVLLLSVLLVSATAVSGCVANPAPASPVGDYAAGSVSFTIAKDGAFSLTHEASAQEPVGYRIVGACTWTTTRRDADNVTSVGRFDLTVTGLQKDGAPVQALDFTDVDPGADVEVGDTLLGWWKYIGLATWPGKMQLKLNLASKGLRPEDENSGSQALWLGDPVR